VYIYIHVLVVGKGNNTDAKIIKFTYTSLCGRARDYVYSNGIDMYLY